VCTGELISVCCLAVTPPQFNISVDELAIPSDSDEDGDSGGEDSEDSYHRLDADVAGDAHEYTIERRAYRARREKWMVMTAIVLLLQGNLLGPLSVCSSEFLMDGMRMVPPARGCCLKSGKGSICSCRRRSTLFGKRVSDRRYCRMRITLQSLASTLRC
jgi:hypothetical protein